VGTPETPETLATWQHCSFATRRIDSPNMPQTLRCDYETLHEHG